MFTLYGAKVAKVYFVSQLLIVQILVELYLHCKDDVFEENEPTSLGVG